MNAGAASAAKAVCFRNVRRLVRIERGIEESPG
jgi:hypothetical protein